jgi:VanZ family protein
MTPAQIDIGVQARALSSQVTITPEENSDDRAARITRENNAASLANFKEYFLFAVVVFFFSAILLLCLWIILDPLAPVERRRWAENVFSVIASGVVSFLLGRKTAK